MKIKINKIYLLSFIFTVLALLVIVFLVVPALQDIKKASNQIVANKAVLLFTDKQSQGVEDFKNSYKTYQSDFKKIDELLIDPKNLVDFIRFLETSASDSDVDLGVNIIPSSKKEMINNLPVTIFDIAAKGGFLNIVRFSEALEKGPYLVRVQSLRVEKPGAVASPAGELEARLLVNVVSK